MLGAFDAVPAFTESDYRSAAGIYRKCRASGEMVGSVVDCLIAQACLSHGYRLLSKDSDFRKIARNTPLRLVELASDRWNAVRGMSRRHRRRDAARITLSSIVRK